MFVSLTPHTPNCNPSSPSSSPGRNSTPRGVSMPTITIPFTSGPSEYDTLPQPGVSGNGLNRGSARRVSYNIKNRAHRHALPLTIGGVVCFLLFALTSFGRSSGSISMFDNGSKLRKYSRDMAVYDKSTGDRIALNGDDEIEGGSSITGSTTRHQLDGERVNGLSVLIADEDELIAEDDLFWETYTESIPLTEEEKAAEEEIQARRQDVIEQDRKHSLSALIYWLVEGGLIPQDWDVPSQAYLKKMGGRGMERLLEAIGSGAEFEEGWADYAKKAYRVAIFSKTYCPYSMNVKDILEGYSITPDPLVIELDQRSDYMKIQQLLENLTGRRTVPNVLMDFHSLGGSDEITLLHAEGGLTRLLEEKDLLPRRRRGGIRLSPPKPPLV